MKFINKYQTNKERKIKYWLCRACGLPYILCYIYRDWRFTKIQIVLLESELLKMFSHKVIYK